MIRLFVGLELDAMVADDLARRGFGLAGARWVERHDLHLTLRFIGEVMEPVAEEIHHQLAAIRLAPFAIDISGLGLFGDGHRAHTLWAGVTRSPALAQLAERVDSACLRGGAKPDSKRFTPHITLARIKDCQPSQVQDFIASQPHPSHLGMAVSHFSLFESRLSRQGAHYDVLERYGLGMAP
jgi:2'-5' RNA ligase